MCFGKGTSLLVPQVIAMYSRFSACGELCALTTTVTA